MFAPENHKKRILFIRTDFWELDKFTHPMHFVPPITLKYAASILKRDSKYEVKIIDCCVDKTSMKELISKTLQQLPLAIVISSSSLSYKKSWEFAQTVKNSHSKIFIIATGHDITSRSDEYLSNASPFDIILKGEAEYEIAEAIQKLSNAAKLEELKESYNRHSPSILSYDLDDLPFPDYTLAELEKYSFLYPLRVGKRIVCGYIISSRGCSHRCIFCTQIVRKSYSKEVRYRSAYNIVDEIEKLMSMKANLIFFMDDNFSTSKEHIMSVCKEIIERRLNINWVASPRIDELDNDLLDTMKRAGCLLLLLSVESGSGRIIRLLDKTQSPDRWFEKAKAIFASAKKLTIGTCALFMVGNPTETENDIEKSISLAKELNPDFIKVHFFTPYPGTPIYERVKKSLPVEDLNLLHHYLPPVVNLTAIDMERLKISQLYFYKKFIFRPCYIICHFVRYFSFYLHNPRVLKILLVFIFRMLKDGLNRRYYSGISSKKVWSCTQD